jgi:hypothetical protein
VANPRRIAPPLRPSLSFLIANLVEVILLLRYGMPYRVRTGGNVARWLNTKADPAVVRAEWWYKVVHARAMQREGRGLREMGALFGFHASTVSRALQASTRVDWIAVDHHNTGHPHTHIIVRGVLDDGRILNIAGDYIAQGIRHRATELVTREFWITRAR